MKENNTNLPLSTEDNSKPEIVFYQPDETIRLEVRMEEDTVWLTQAQISILFNSSRTNIIEHIQNIYIEQELEENATCRKFRQVRQEGNRTVVRAVPFYNLDMIISVGYRVKSNTATKFRQWATRTLKEHILKVNCNQGCSMFKQIAEHEHRLNEQSEMIKFFVQHNLPPTEGIFFSGQVLV